VQLEVAAYPNHHIKFNACGMILRVHSDASYLSRSNARSVAGGIFYCGSDSGDDEKTGENRINGGLLAISCIIPTVCSSAAEAEYAALFVNGQHGIWLRTILSALGYPQIQPTLMICDNECAVGIANDSVKMRRSKAIDMRYHWVKDRVKNGEFSISWLSGSDNYADFFTKALPVHLHQSLKARYVWFRPDPSNNSLNSCAKRKQQRCLANKTFTLY
jgi:hypothetical protein